MPTETATKHASLVLLMIESEQPEGISSRKLVVETAKHNVLTAYRPDTGLALLRRFPAVDAILVHASVLDHLPLIPQLHEISPEIPIIVTAPRATEHFDGADYTVSSHEPQQLLDLLARIFGVSKSSD